MHARTKSQLCVGPEDMARIGQGMSSWGLKDQGSPSSSSLPGLSRNKAVFWNVTLAYGFSPPKP